MGLFKFTAVVCCFIFGAASGYKLKRELQFGDVNCATVIPEVRVPRYNSCGCSHTQGTGGHTVDVNCTGCPEVCGIGSCGTGMVSRNLEIESDGSIIGTQEECFEYFEIVEDEAVEMAVETGSPAKGKICKIQDAQFTTCAISVDGNVCSSCEVVTCDDETKEYKADCTNLAGGQVFDFCQPIAVLDKTSPFVWFDSEFEVDITDCNANSGAMTRMQPSLIIYTMAIVLSAFSLS